MRKIQNANCQEFIFNSILVCIIFLFDFRLYYNKKIKNKININKILLTQNKYKSKKSNIISIKSIVQFEENDYN